MKNKSTSATFLPPFKKGQEQNEWVHLKELKILYINKTLAFWVNYLTNAPKSDLKSVCNSEEEKNMIRILIAVDFFRTFAPFSLKKNGLGADPIIWVDGPM